MIDINEIFLGQDKNVALWCDNVSDTSDIALTADNIVQMGVDLISLPTDMVQDMWVYLEKSPIKILTRYNLVSNRKNIDEDIALLAKNIKNVCKHGADGIQIFLKMHDFDVFMEKISPVKADLFFQKKLSFCFDIMDIDTNNLEKTFKQLNEFGVDAFGLTLNEDMGNRSDFVGRVYAILNNWNFNGDLHFMLGNDYERIEQVVRLTESEKPELMDKIKFFLEY